MKLAHSLVSTSIVCMGFSLGLAACGSGSSSSNPGIGGTSGASTDIAATCPNPIRADDPGFSAVANEASVPNANYSLTHLTMYVYNPANGDSFVASADQKDGFHATMGCNITTQERGETTSAPDSLDSSRNLGPNDQDRELTVNFERGRVDAQTSLVPDRSGTFAFDHIGKGRELSSPDTFVTYEISLMPNGGLEIRSKMELPADPSTGKSKRIYTSAQYASQVQIQPAPGRPSEPAPGSPGRR